MPNTVPDNPRRKHIHVAVGVIVNSDRKILISRRLEHTHLGGLWEFPGGKVESRESVARALDRELHEELGLRVLSSRPMMEVRHDYSDRSVLLDVWWVEAFTGEPEGKEGQSVRWVAVADFSHYEFPAANQPIVEAVRKALLQTASPNQY